MLLVLKGIENSVDRQVALYHCRQLCNLYGAVSSGDGPTSKDVLDLRDRIRLDLSVLGSESLLVPKEVDLVELQESRLEASGSTASKVLPEAPVFENRESPTASLG
jgi:hypothetical protein